MSRGGVVVVLVAVAAACGPAVPFRLAVERGGPVSRFRLIGRPGARINARLKPALELPDGTVLRFDSPHVTGDTAYFVDAPMVAATLEEDAHAGLLRASVCPAGEQVCRSFALAVRF